jgi:hypothetical protein
VQRAFPVRELAVDTATINVEMDPEDEFRVRSAIAADHGMQCAARARAAARARCAAVGGGCPARGRRAASNEGRQQRGVWAGPSRHAALDPCVQCVDPYVSHTLALSLPCW